MGASISTGQDNDDLIDNLIASGYIKTKKVEQVFRAVDRADYVLSSHRERAYKDLAWKHGNIHLSAPCVYSEVMEGLSLEPGLSFLNIGSGTGYISTMAGLILTQRGTNHGIELHDDCVKYAYERLEEFKQKSRALDEFDFCEPLFIQGNCLSIVPGRQYDRVYCGAACPESHEAFIKQLVRIGGILVMPFKDHLLRIQRVDENAWTQRSLLPVSFTSLVVPTSAEHNLIHLPECDPLSLQELCRGRIRCRLRQNVWHEHPEIEKEKPILPKRENPNRSGYGLGRLVIPILEESNEADSDSDDLTTNARLLLSVDTRPGQNITTTLQFVGAVFQPNRDETRPDCHGKSSNENGTENGNENGNGDRSVEFEETRETADLDLFEESRESDKQEFLMEHSSRSDSNETSNRQDIASQSQKENGATSERKTSEDVATTNAHSNAHSNASDTDSDAERDSAFAQRKKIAKREKSDSGIVEDASLTNDDGSSSSNTNQSDSEVVDSTDQGDPMDVDLYDITPNKSFMNAYNSHGGSSDVPNRETLLGHYIDGEAFAGYMKEKIHQLPLPFSLKLYINYNRTL